MWGEAGYGWGWGMGLGMISMVLFWVLVILGIVVLVRYVGGSSASSGPPPSKTALDLLNERYARGEIDKQDYEERKRDLGKKHARNHQTLSPSGCASRTRRRAHRGGGAPHRERAAPVTPSDAPRDRALCAG